MPFKDGKWVPPGGEWATSKKEPVIPEPMPDTFSSNDMAKQYPIEQEPIAGPPAPPEASLMSSILGRFKDMGSSALNTVETAAKNTFDSLTDNLSNIGTPDISGMGNELLDKVKGNIPGFAKSAMNNTDISKGFTQPNLQDRSLTEDLGAGLRRWSAGQFNTAANVASWGGAEGISKQISEFAPKSEGFESEHKFEGWHSLYDPHWLAGTLIGEGVPSALSLMPLAIGGAELGATGAAAFGMGKVGTTIMRALGGTLASRPVESVMEAAQTYESMEGTHEQKQSAANDTFLKNMAVGAPLDMLELGSVFMPKGIGGIVSKLKLDTLPAKIAANTVLEGGEEGVQTWIQNSSQGKPTSLNDPAMKEAIATGGLLGGLMGGAFSVTEHLQKAKDNVTSIQTRAINKMDDDTKADFMDSLNDAKEQGIPEEEAISHMLETWANTPEGQQAITEATQEIVESVRTEQEVSSGQPATAPIEESSAPETTTAPVEQTPTVDPKAEVETALPTEQPNAQTEPASVSLESAPLDEIDQKIQELTQQAAPVQEPVQEAVKQPELVAPDLEPWRESQFAKDGNVDEVSTDWLSSIQGNDLRYGTDVEPEKMKALMDDIQKNGFKEPLMVMVGRENRAVMLGEGNHRLEAARRLGYKYVPVYVKAKKGFAGEWADEGTLGIKMSRVPEKGDFPEIVSPRQAFDDIPIRKSDTSVKEQPITAPAKPSTSSDYEVKVGDSVSHKSFKGQNFTVTGVKGNMVSLKSEKGGELNNIHKSALTPKAAAEPMAQEPVISDAKKVDLSQLSDKDLSLSLMQGFFATDNGKMLSPEEQSNFEALQAEKNRRESGKEAEKRKASGFSEEQWSAFDQMKQESEIKKNKFEPIGLHKNPQTGEEVILGVNGKDKPITELERHMTPKEESKPVVKRSGTVNNLGESIRVTKKESEVVPEEEPAAEEETKPTESIKEEPVIEQKRKGGKTDAQTNGGNDSSVVEDQQTGNVSESAAGRNDSETPGVDGRRGDRAGRSDDEGESTSGGSAGESESNGANNSNSAGDRESSVSRRTGDFVITDELDKLGGAKTKFKANVSAIRLLRQIEKEGRQATNEEQIILSKYVGWGGIAEAFDDRKKDSEKWGKEYAELRSLVDDGIITEAEYKEMTKSTLNAHYTASAVVNSMYDALRQFGFTGGRVLEPSMGTGNFFGLMPKDMTKGSQRIGVELDSVTGGIAKLLYPKADVHVKGFQDYKISDGYFDLAIGNVPFGSFGVVDPNYNKQITGKIHNYFFVKSLDKVRDGGLLMFITSAGTLNAPSAESARQAMADRADFVGAIRLPSDAFKASAGTEVTTDVIIFKKRAAGQAANHAGDFLNTYSEEVWKEDNSDESFDVNNNVYFRQHPEMVLGTYTVDKLTGKRLGVKSDGRDITAALQEAISKLPKNIYESRVTSSGEFTQQQATQEKSNGWSGVEDGAHFIENGKLMKREGDSGIASKLTGAEADRVRNMIPLRDGVRKLIRDMQNPSVTDKEIENQQKTLSRQYDAFVKKFGPLNDSKNRKLMLTDPIGSGVLFSTEQYEKEGTKVTAKKGAIFSKRTIRPVKTKDNVDTAEEALVLSLFEKGKLDLAYMSKTTGIPEDQIIEQLKGRIYFDPNSDTYTVADEYLSGNVREKLVQAQEAATNDPKFKENVAALEAVQPRDLEPHEITVRIGSTWIPTEDYQDFVNDILGTNKKVKIIYDKFAAKWKVEENLRNYPSLFHNKRNTEEYAVPGKLTMLEILEASLNLQAAKVTYKDEDKKTIVDDEKTAVAQNVQSQLQMMFQDWIWSKGERSDRLAQKYNWEYNNIKLRDYDGQLIYGKGDQHVPIPGLANEIYKLRPHQKDAIWRALQGKNTLFAHVVGAGKTLEIIVTAMEMRRLGIANKPTLVTKNSLVDQMYGDVFAAYPGAKVLKLTSEDIPPVTPAKSKKHTKEEAAARVEKNRLERATILSKIATGDYDLILMSHELFARLPVSPELQQSHIEQQIEEIEAAIQGMEEDGADRRSVKKLEETKEKLRVKLRNNLDEDKKDIVMPFEELGIDQLFVDESHMFKNLSFHTKMVNIAGISSRASKRSEDMYLKSQWLTKTRNGGGVIFATGTPIANTMSEMFTLQRYLQGDKLREMGLEHFDSWAAMFGETTSDFEMTASGQFKQRTRFAQFNNVPELLQQFFTFADVKTADKLDLPKPKTVNRETVSVPLSEGQKAYMKDLVSRAENMKNVDPSQDNYLKLTSDGKKMAVDLRLVDPNAKDEKSSKLNTAVNNIAKIYKDKSLAQRTSKKTGKPIATPTQIVFLDLGTPKKEKESDKEDDLEKTTDEALAEVMGEEGQTFNQLYKDIKEKLIKKGIPEAEIAFIHDAKTPQQKDTLTRKVREGRIRVLLGSSEKMGAGLNVQDKLVALHHIDPTWRPADIE